jgi:type II secretory pathway component PulF
MGITEDLAREFRCLVRPLPLKDVAVFSGNLATCLQAGLNVPESIETCTRSSPNALFRSSGKRVAEKTRAGAPLSEAMGEMAVHLPRFYLPVLQCGEQSGRIDEALRYLQEHCTLLEKPYQAMRSLWLVPLVLYSVANVILIVAYFLLAPFFTASQFLAQTVMQYAMLGAIVLLVLNVPRLRRLWEHLLLALPFVGRSAREVAVNRFLHAFNLMYRTSGTAVPQMVRTACSAVGNTIVRDEFLTAIPHLERGRTLSESMANCVSLTHDQKAMIASGEQAGRIEEALGRLCRQTSESLQFRLQGFRAVYFRLITFFVVLGTAMTLRGLLSLYYLR